LVTAPGLGPSLRATVVDAATGAVLYAHDAGTPTAPASTAKLLTAAALLAVRPAATRLTTRVVAGTDGAVVLVGAGDPTLTGAPAGKPGAYPEAARISDLAAQLRKAGVRPTRIVVDDALFAGPTIAPQWAPEDVPSDYASGITAVMADGGRPTPDATIRTATPDLAAGQELAVALGSPSLPVVRGTPSAGAATLASVQSASFGLLIEQMLQASDNVIAECLARQVALAEGQPASFTGAANAVRTVLTRLGVDPGAGMVDGSGLAAGDRLSATTLAGVLRLVTQRPQLRTVLAGLPVAGWSGTLADRYLGSATHAAAGLVRAKTGTLTGVSSLAGTVHDHDGRLLVFAVVADQAPDTPDAEAALDRIATQLAACGCR
ncbi:MAG: D-alanyl-D-alanine carboxypeptidase/D-alanyl-D-alanine-endopeptidase, partial [Actinobacteria bacterium]|nr:D-alanyl-D-alanine carboxypeptidase/D-alanyl-D-alanine-endopeptidase [Actinomycetota bacterium]